LLESLGLLKAVATDVEGQVVDVDEDLDPRKTLRDVVLRI
jgi:hypothetical protein